MTPCWNCGAPALHVDCDGDTCYKCNTPLAYVLTSSQYNDPGDSDE